MADKAGTSTDAIVSVAKQFDKFSDGARAVGRLNTALGKNVFNFQRMNMLSPADRMHELREGILANVGSLKTMNHQQKQFLASAAGFQDVGTMMEFLQNKGKKAEERFKSLGLTNKEVEEIGKKSKTAMELLQVSLQQLAITVQPIVAGFSEFASTIADFLSGPGGEILMWAVLGLAGFVMLIKVLMAVKSAFAGLKLLLGASAAGGALAQASANMALANSYQILAAAAAAAAPAVTAISGPLAIIAFSIAATVLAITAFIYIAISAKVPLTYLGLGFLALAAGVAILAFALTSLAATTVVSLVGIGLLVVATGALALALAFIKTEDLQAIATIFKSMAETASRNPFASWISGIKGFAKAADDVKGDISKIGTAFSELDSDMSKVAPVVTVVKAMGGISDTTVKGLAEATMLVKELRVAVDNESATALQNLINSFAKAAAPAASGGNQRRGGQGDIVLKLDGREVGRFVNKVMEEELKSSAFR